MKLTSNQRLVWITGGVILLLIGIYTTLLQRETYTSDPRAGTLPKCSTGKYPNYDNTLSQNVARVMPDLDRTERSITDLLKRYNESVSADAKRNICDQYRDVSKIYGRYRDNKLKPIHDMYENNLGRFEYDERTYNLWYNPDGTVKRFKEMGVTL